jgi:hypothetical protein
MNSEVIRIITEKTIEMASSMSTSSGGMGTIRMTMSAITPVARAISPERSVSITLLTLGSLKPGCSGCRSFAHRVFVCRLPPP